MPWLLLQVTRDHALAATRQALLEPSFSVRETNLAFAWQHFRSADFDAVILCSSLSWSECAPLIEKVIHAFPSTLIFRIGEPLAHASSQQVIFIPPFEPQEMGSAMERALLSYKHEFLRKRRRTSAVAGGRKTA